MKTFRMSPGRLTVLGWLMFATPSQAQTQPLTDVTVATGEMGTRFAVERFSRNHYYQAEANNHQQLFARYGRVFSWEESKHERLSDLFTATPFVGAGYDRTRETYVLAAGGILKIAVTHLRTAKWTDGALKVEGDNRVVWTRHGTHLEVAQRLSLMKHPLIGLRMIAVEQRYAIYPGPITGTPYVEKSFQGNPGRVHNIRPQRVQSQRIFSATYELGRGYVRVMRLTDTSEPPSILFNKKSQKPKYEIGYTLRF